MVALNKIDAGDSKVEKSREIVRLSLHELSAERMLEMSAKNASGINEVIRAIYSVLRVAPALDTEDVYTEQDIAFRIS